MLRFLADRDIRLSLREHAPRLFGGALAMFGRSLLALAGPFFLGRGVQLVEQRASEETLYRTVSLLLLFALGTAFCQFWMRWIWIGWSRDAELLTRDRLFERLMHLSPPFFDRSRTGDLLSRLISDVEAVRMGYGPGIMHCLATAVMTVGAAVLMLLHSPKLTAIASVPLLVLFFIMRSLLPRIHELSLRVQEQQANLSTRAQESFSGARVIKAFAREAHEEQDFKKLSSIYVDQSLALARTRGFFACVVEVFGGVMVVTVLLFGGRLVIEGDIDLGDFTAFIGYLNLLVWPMIAIGWTLALFQRADAAEERLTALRTVEPEINDGPGAELRNRVPPDVEFRRLTFAFPENREPVLRDIDVRIRGGSLLGIVGATASGKSVLASLLPRLLDPPPGTVFLGGRDVRDFKLDDLRGQIALVPQESFLFSDSIARNIAFSVGDAPRSRILEAVRLSCLDEDILTFPDGLETLVGERGITLSGGQRQRTALARALLVNAPVLILDDALSAVDTETERRILDRLDPFLRQRTTFLISHRLSAVATADHIIVLENGAIIEEGEHSALLRQQGLYARLWKLQQEEEELEQL